MRINLALGHACRRHGLLLFEPGMRPDSGQEPGLAGSGIASDAGVRLRFVYGIVVGRLRAVHPQHVFGGLHLKKMNYAHMKERLKLRFKTKSLPF